MPWFDQLRALWLRLCDFDPFAVSAERRMRIDCFVHMMMLVILVLTDIAWPHLIIVWLFSIWNYGMGFVVGSGTAHTVRMSRTKLYISGSLAEDIYALMPGQALRCDAPNGMEFVVLPSDDFEHILSLAGMRSNPIVSEKKNAED